MGKELTPTNNTKARGDDEQDIVEIQAPPEEGEARPSRGTVFTFRLPREELAALERAAADAGLSVSEYLRKSAAMRPATSVLAKPQVNISINTNFSQSGNLSTWSESPASIAEWKTSTKGKITLQGE